MRLIYNIRQCRFGLCFCSSVLGALVLAATPTQFLVARNQVGALALGMPEAEIYKVYPQARTRKVDLQLEGFPTPAVELYIAPRRSLPALVVRLSVPGNRIEGIEVHDARFRDKAGIHVGSSFGQLRKAHSELDFALGEGQYFAAQESTGISFQLALDNWTEAALQASAASSAHDYLSKIPARTPVVSIWAYLVERAGQGRTMISGQ